MTKKQWYVIKDALDNAYARENVMEKTDEPRDSDESVLEEIQSAMDVLEAIDYEE